MAKCCYRNPVTKKKLSFIHSARKQMPEEHEGTHNLNRQQDWVKDIYDALNMKAIALYRNWHEGSRTKWTKKTKETLESIAGKHSFKVWGGSVNSEWLFDLVWVDQKACDEDSKQWWEAFDGLRLACEIEWDDSIRSHMEDFLKLTVAIADLRVFIYSARNNDYTKQFERLRNIVILEFNPSSSLAERQQSRVSV